jgi:hypothetical protein
MKTPFRKTGVAAIIPAILVIMGIVYFGASLCARDAGKVPTAGAKNDDSRTTRLHINVTGGRYDKPVGNASVYIRFPEKPGSDKLAELDLKTDEDGNVRVPPVPRGKIMIQVVAPSWKTFGKWYDMEEPDEQVKIHLEDPPHWY